MSERKQVALFAQRRVVDAVNISRGGGFGVDLLDINGDISVVSQQTLQKDFVPVLRCEVVDGTPIDGNHFLVRLMAEKAVLNKDVEGLSKFIESGAIDKLSDEESNLLREQLEVQKKLLSILVFRIDLSLSKGNLPAGVIINAKA